MAYYELLEGYFCPFFLIMKEEPLYRCLAICTCCTRVGKGSERLSRVQLRPLVSLSSVDAQKLSGHFICCTLSSTISPTTLLQSFFFPQINFLLQEDCSWEKTNLSMQNYAKIEFSLYEVPRESW